MHRDYRFKLWHELRDSISRALRPHREVVPNAHQREVRAPEVVYDAHVAKHVRVACVVDVVLAVRGMDDPSARLPGKLPVESGGVQRGDEGGCEAPADGDSTALVESDELGGGDAGDCGDEVDEVKDGVELGVGVLLEEVGGVAKVVIVPVGEEDGGGVVLAQIGGGGRALGILNPWVDVNLLSVTGDTECGMTKITNFICHFKKKKKMCICYKLRGKKRNCFIG